MDEKEFKKKLDEAIATEKKGLSEINKGSFKEAIKFYDEAEQKLNDIKKQELSKEQAAVVVEKLSIAYNNRGTAYARLTQYENAIKDQTEAIRIREELLKKHPDDKAIANDLAGSYNNRGNTYDDLGEYQKALADYDKAIELNPKYAAAYNNRGVTYKNLGEYQKALADYDKAIELNPKYATAYINRGVTYKNLGEDQKALADYIMQLILHLMMRWLTTTAALPTMS